MKLNQLKILFVFIIVTFLFSQNVFSTGSQEKDNKVMVYNSANIVKSIEGYAGPTPINVYVKGNKIVKIELLKNYETPKYLYFVQQSGLLKKWNGMNLDDVVNTKVDVVSGATYTSNSIIETVKEVVRYIKKTRKK